MKFSLSIAAILLCTASAFAIKTEHFTQDTFSEFAEGQAKGVAISNDGFLKVGPSFEQKGTLPVSTIWDATLDSKGQLYVAAGNDGQVFRVDSSGKATEVFKAKEMQIQSITFDSQGNLFAASMPDGKVYKIDSKGKSSVYFEPKEKYIWAIRFDRKGNLFVATGDKGKLYKVTGNGKGSVFYDSDETHLRTLLISKNQKLWVGTEGTGLVYRFDQTNDATASPFVVYDSSFREIKALVEDERGTVFLAAMGDSKSSSMSLPSLKLTLSESSSDSGAGPSVSSPELSKKDDSSSSSFAEKDGAGEIIRISPDGSYEKWWSQQEDVYTIAIVDSGYLWAGTGKNGRVIELRGPKEFSVLGQLEGETVSSLIAVENGCYALSSNPGALWMLNKQKGRKGTYESKIFDTRSSSRWGALEFRYSTEAKRLQIVTRSGNTSKPDKVWSNWKALEESKIVSPIARFIQYKILFEDADSNDFEIDRISLFYQLQNAPPRIHRLSLYPANVELVKMPRPEMPMMPAAAGGGASPKTKGGGDTEEAPMMMRGPNMQQVKRLGMRSASWQVADPNEDSVSFDVFYRSAGVSEWKLLKKDLDDPFISWDASQWPDGEYYLKVIASDIESNLESQAKKDESTSDVFLVDNTSPQIVSTPPDKKSSDSVTLTISDEISIIDEAEYSIDGKGWRPLLPNSGLYDSRSNDFTISVKDLKAGSHYITIRASDSANNVANHTVKFKK
jgi:ligand-binding sensor domain-containing protein